MFTIEKYGIESSGEFDLNHQYIYGWGRNVNPPSYRFDGLGKR